MKRSCRLLILFLCFTLLGACILSNLTVNAAEDVRDSLAKTVDEVNSLSVEMRDVDYGTALKNILDSRRLSHYASNNVRTEIKKYVDLLDDKITSLDPDSKSYENKTELLGLTLKGLYTGALAWIYHTYADESIRDITLNVSVEFNASYQITTKDYTVADYYTYLRDEAIGGKSNRYIKDANPEETVYRYYFSWMLQAIYEAKLSLLTPDDSAPLALRENVRNITTQAHLDINYTYYQSGVPTETADGTILTEGEDGGNYYVLYEKARLAVEFANIYAEICPDETFDQSDATRNLITDLSAANRNADANAIIQTALSEALEEKKELATDQSYVQGYYDLLQTRANTLFDDATAHNSLASEDELRKVFDGYELGLDRAEAKDEIGATVGEMLANEARYPAGSQEKTNLEQITATAIAAIDAAAPDRLTHAVAEGTAQAILYDEYLDSLEECDLPYLTSSELTALKDNLSAQYLAAGEAIGAAADLAAIDGALTEVRLTAHTLLLEAEKNNLTKKTAAIQATVESYEYLDEDAKLALTTQLTEALAKGLTDLGAASDRISAESAEQALDELLNTIDREAAKQEFSKAMEHLTGKKDEYSEEQYGKLTDLVEQANGSLDDTSSREDYLEMKEQVLTQAGELPNILDDAFEELLANKNSYSEESWSILEGIYLQTKEELESTSGTLTAPELIRDRIEKMREVNTNVLYTPDKQLASDRPEDYREGDNYYGSISSPNGIPSNGILQIGRVGKDSGKSAANRIMQAAKNGRITDPYGRALSKDLIRLLKNCSVPFGFDVSFSPLEIGKTYSVSVLLPQNISLANVIGIVFLDANGTAEYYEITSRDQLITFDTSRFDTYYLVSANTVNLLPIIIILSVILAAEVVVLAWMYLRRSRKKKLPPTTAALALVPPYFPENGWMAVVLLSVAILLLGGWIAWLPLSEKLAELRANRPAKAPRREEEQTEEEEEIPEETVETTPELPEAEAVPALAGAKERAALPGAEARAALPGREAVQSLPGRDPLFFLPPVPEPVIIDLESYTGHKKGEINLDIIAAHFEEGDRITLNDLKRKKLIPNRVGYVKILGRGRLGKAMTILAQDFSAEAIEKIEEDGGCVILTHASPKCGGRRACDYT